MRILYYAPIFHHSLEEMGSLAKQFVETKKRLYGPRAEETYREKTKKCWANIDQQIEKIASSISTKIHIYMDGLPCIEDHHLLKIVKEIIAQKLPQYLIAEKLMKNGAITHGTEDVGLLLEEEEKNTIMPGMPGRKRREVLLRERDVFIAKTINKTLPDGEVGILFIGADHRADNEIKKIGIKVLYIK
jgi:metal-dependent amidase/aminoacylase/carboxypeptidase family protein